MTRRAWLQFCAIFAACVVLTVLIVIPIVLWNRSKFEEFDQQCQARGGHVVPGTRTSLCLTSDGRFIDWGPGR